VGDGEELYAVPELLPEGIHYRDHGPAGGAPGGPEIDDEEFAFQLGQAEGGDVLPSYLEAGDVGDGYIGDLVPDF
jgi:hypothetical protein